MGIVATWQKSIDPCLGVCLCCHPGLKYEDDGAVVDGKRRNAVTDAHRGFGRKWDSIQYDASEGSDPQHQADVA